MRIKGIVSTCAVLAFALLIMTGQAFADAKSLTTEGNALLKKADYKGALAKFQAATTEDGEYVDAWIGGAKAAEKLEDWATVKKNYLTVIEFLDKDNFDARLGAGDYFLRAKKYADAQTHLTEAVKLQPGNAQVHYALGDLYYKTKKTTKAKTEYKKGLTLEPDAHLIALYRLGRIEYDDGKASKKFDEAIKYYDQYIAQGKDKSTLFSIQTDLGLIYQQLGKNQLALSHLNKAKQLKPDDYRPYFYSAEIHRSQKQMKEAEAEYLGVLERNQKHGSSHYQLAIYYQQSYQDAKALEHYKAAAQDTKFKGRKAAGEQAAALDKYLKEVEKAEAAR